MCMSVYVCVCARVRVCVGGCVSVAIAIVKRSVLPVYVEVGRCANFLYYYYYYYYFNITTERERERVGQERKRAKGVERVSDDVFAMTDELSICVKAACCKYVSSPIEPNRGTLVFCINATTNLLRLEKKIPSTGVKAIMDFSCPLHFKDFKKKFTCKLRSVPV